MDTHKVECEKCKEDALKIAALQKRIEDMQNQIAWANREFEDRACEITAQSELLSWVSDGLEHFCEECFGQAKHLKDEIQAALGNGGAEPTDPPKEGKT